MRSRTLSPGRPATVHRRTIARSRGHSGRTFGTLWLATGSANLGDGIGRLAMPLLVLGQGGSAVAVASVALAGRLPWLLGALPAGLLVDRLDRRGIAVGANLARVLVLGLIGALAANGTVGVAVVLVATFLIGLAEVLADSATQSMIPAVVAADHLTVANQRLIGTETVANEFSGPALGGVVSALGAALAFVTGAGLFLVAAGSLLLMRGTFGVPVERAAMATGRASRDGGWLAELLGGWRFIRATPVLRGLVLSVLGTSMTWSAQQAVLVIYLVAPGPGELSPAAFGFVLGGIGVGGLLATLTVNLVVRRIGELWTFALDLLGCVAMVAVPLLTANPWWVAGATIGAGFGSGMWSVLVSTMRQRLTPPDLIGRVSSTYRLFSMGSTTFGIFTVVAALAALPFLVWVRPAMRAGAAGPPA